MADTILLSTGAWDLTLDVDGNIAVATEPLALAQDAASAIRTFLGECYYDSTIGVPYFTQILGKNPPLATIKQFLVAAALTVPGVAAAKVFITQFTDRVLAGQVQVTSLATGQVVAADFVAIDPQGT